MTLEYFFVFFRENIRDLSMQTIRVFSKARKPCNKQFHELYPFLREEYIEIIKINVFVFFKFWTGEFFDITAFINDRSCDRIFRPDQQHIARARPRAIPSKWPKEVNLARQAWPG